MCLNMLNNHQPSVDITVYSFFEYIFLKNMPSMFAIFISKPIPELTLIQRGKNKTWMFSTIIKIQSVHKPKKKKIRNKDFINHLIKVIKKKKTSIIHEMLFV